MQLQLSLAAILKPLAVSIYCGNEVNSHLWLVNTSCDLFSLVWDIMGCCPQAASHGTRSAHGKEWYSSSSSICYWCWVWLPRLKPGQICKLCAQKELMKNNRIITWNSTDFFFFHLDPTLSQIQVKLNNKRYWKSFSVPNYNDFIHTN